MTDIASQKCCSALDADPLRHCDDPLIGGTLAGWRQRFRCSRPESQLAARDNRLHDAGSSSFVIERPISKVQCHRCADRPVVHEPNIAVALVDRAHTALGWLVSPSASKKTVDQGGELYKVQKSPRLKRFGDASSS